MQDNQPITSYPHHQSGAESTRGVVSWGAVIAGAVIAAAITAMLNIGGIGFGFISMSPWHNEGSSGSALAIGSIVWLCVVQIIAYGVAGYVAGRLRTKWTDAADDEVYFRDTAHGFLVWALSAVVAMILLGMTVMSAVSGTAKVGATLAGAGAGAASAVAGQAAHAGADNLSLDYFTDTLLRPNDLVNSNNRGDMHQEASRILARSLESGKLSDADQDYLVKLVAQQVGVDEATARQRLKQVEEQAKQAAQKVEQNACKVADRARKAAAAFSLWAFVSLLLGAFVASFFATLGGRARRA